MAVDDFRDILHFLRRLLQALDSALAQGLQLTLLDGCLELVQILLEDLALK